MADNSCPVCHHQNRIGNRYCTQCGSKLVSEKKAGAHLVIMSGNYHKRIALTKSSNTIGRDDGNLIYFDDNQVSKTHAVISFENDQYWIKDLNSKNGVYLNGKKIDQAERLHDGSILKIGTKILRFEIDKSNVSKFA